MVVREKLRQTEPTANPSDERKEMSLFAKFIVEWQKKLYSGAIFPQFY